jgi:DNA adenine methylase
MVATSNSPLRYPGGKQILARVLGHLIKLNGCEGGTYVEPYAGGAGAALTLLFGEYVSRMIINDADTRIYAFWNAILNQTERFLGLLRDTNTTVDEWRRQRQIYLHPTLYSSLRVGFATFFLNRCNRSGIIGSGGLIGGVKQNGKWKLDARFNKNELGQRIGRIARYKERITIANMDAIELLKKHVAKPAIATRTFVYLDPPYYAKGKDLYHDHYIPSDHAALASFLRDEASFTWVMSYDNVPEIRSLYKGLRQINFNLGYSAHKWRTGEELLITPQSVRLPTQWRKRIPDVFISAADQISSRMSL